MAKARRGSKSAGFWMIRREKNKEQIISGMIEITAKVGIPFAVSVNAFFYIFDI
jgi:hypothetical protein